MLIIWVHLEPIFDLETSKSEKFSAQSVCLLKALDKIGKDKIVKVDLSKSSWIVPSIALPLYALQKESIISVDWTKSLGKSYLQTIGFDNGIDEINPLFSGTYVPILNLKNKHSQSFLDNVAKFQELIYSHVGSGNKSTLSIPIGELTDNIFDHSKADCGYVLGQFYRNKNILEISIVDRGRGVANSYIEEFGSQKTDREALESALAGISTKGQERGFGLGQTLKIVTQAYGGEVLIVSGKVAYYNVGNREGIIESPSGSAFWKGVIINYRIPCPNKQVDYTEYTF